jgi:DNA (cytosine-5)-methyltransferase 1
MTDMTTNHEKKPRHYTVVSLFSGGGGMSLGFSEAGFTIILNSDIEVESQNTLKLNWPSVPFLLQDIRTITEEQLRQVIGPQNPDIIIGGPPCQGFSNMGDKNGSDPRNYLIDAYTRIISWLKPSCVLTENVAGLLSLHNGQFYNKICNSLANLGYDVYSTILDAVNYGVPEKRRRLFIFATRLKNNFSFPEPSQTSIGTIVPRTTVGEAISDLMGRERLVPNHFPLKHSEKVIARYLLIPEGGKLPPPEQLPEEIRRGNFGNTYERLNRNAPSSAMVPGNNAFPIHPILSRSLTPREAARIQSFPDEHIFTGTRARQCQLVGNAVPPLLAANIAKSILKHIEGSCVTNQAHKIVRFRFKPIEEEINAPSRRNQHSRLTAVDLFSGAGGFTQGFKQAGFNVLLAVDIDKYAASIHIKNHPDVPFINGDLTDPEMKSRVQQIIGLRKVDVLVGGPPCQGFSIFGHRRFINSRKFDPSKDARNNLVDVFWQYVELLKPDWVIMENVTGFTSLSNGYYFNRAKDTAEKLGYRVETNILNAADYGVPQIRRRFILIATKTGLLIPWPKAKFFETPKEWQKPYRTVGEVLTDLDNKASYDTYPNHNPPKHHPIIVERFSYIQEGKKLDTDLLPDKLKLGLKTGNNIKNYSHVFRRLDRNKPSATMVPGHNAFPVHPWLNRTLTIREVARIQTFPDNYIFEGPIINQGLQVGNAFPCLLAQTLAERLQRVVRNEWTSKTVTSLASYSMLDTGV